MKRKIPFAEPILDGNELNYVSECIKTNWISSVGKYVQEFEEKFSKYCGVKYGIATTSGTSALHLVLATLKVSKGDEVILPTLTMGACGFAVAYTGATPVFVDSEPKTWNINHEKIEEKITKRTKVIIPVHLYGHPCEMDAIRDIASDKGIYVVEDAAEAHGALYKNKKVGSLSDLACFSFYGNKIITTGEGGMIVTDNKELAERAQKLKNMCFGAERKFLHPEIGYNYRMTNIQAAIGVAQLEKIEEFVELRRKNAKFYNSLLKNIKGITLPPELPYVRNVYWMYSVLIEDSFGISRDKLMKELKEKGIDTRTFFITLNKQPFFPKNNKENYPIAEELSRKGINLPSAATLKKEEIKYIVDSIKSIIK